MYVPVLLFLSLLHRRSCGLNLLTYFNKVCHGCPTPLYPLPLLLHCIIHIHLCELNPGLGNIHPVSMQGLKEGHIKVGVEDRFTYVSGGCAYSICEDVDL